MNYKSHDERVAVRAIQQLLLERLIERTAEQIMHKARMLVNKYKLNYLSDAYEIMEDQLLAKNPSPEQWDTL